MKKSIRLLLIFALFISSAVSINAANNNLLNNNNNRVHIDLRTKSKQEAESILESYGLDVEDKEDEDFEGSIIYGDLLIEYEEPIYQSKILRSKYNGETVPTRTCYFSKSYIGDPKTINPKDLGLSHWLDVVWNLSIGTRTKHLWKIATVLDLNPSNFSIEWNTGDKLTKTESIIRRYNCAQVKPGPTWTTLVSAERVEAITSASIKGTDKNGKYIEDNQYNSKFYYSDYYNKPTYLVARARELYDKYGLLVIENHKVK